MTITTEEAELLATLAEEWDRYELGKKAPEIAWNWERAPVVIRSLAAERDALKAENSRLREAPKAERDSDDITVNLSQVARAHKQGGEPWQYVSIYDLADAGVRIECAVLINGDLAEALKIAGAALGEKE
jgi:hypothetical protein